MGAPIQLYRRMSGGVHALRPSATTCTARHRRRTPLMALRFTFPDLRRASSYVIAALVAEGASTLTNTRPDPARL